MNPSVLKVKEKNPQCKGTVWRGRRNVFMTDDGRIKESVEMRILKRESCPGCSNCGWLIDFLLEDIQSGDIESLLSDIKDQKKYTVSVDSSRDWESGNWEIDGWQFNEIDD